MKLNPSSILLIVLMLALPASLTADDNDRKAPNIIFIMADDMAWADVGYNGQQDFETPHIDQWLPMACASTTPTPELRFVRPHACLLYTSPSPRDRTRSRMPSSA